MLEAAIKIAAEAALSKILEQGLDLALADKIDPLLLAVQRLEVRVDSQLLTSLGAGLTFLKLGDHGQAIRELVRAEAADSAAAVSAFWLGVALAISGRKSEGAPFVERALSLNPYLIDGAICDVGTVPQPSLPVEPETPRWSLNLLDIRRSPLVRPRWRPAWTMKGGESAVERVSLSDGASVLQCSVHWPFTNFQDQPMLAAFTGSGELAWVRRTRDELLFASQKVVALRASAEPRYRLLSIETGDLVRDYGAEYFATAFCPRLALVEGSKAFQLGNRAFSTADEMWAAAARQYPDCAAEEGTVWTRDRTRCLTVRNRWWRWVHMSPGGAHIPTMSAQASLKFFTMA